MPGARASDRNPDPQSAFNVGRLVLGPMQTRSSQRKIFSPSSPSAPTLTASRSSGGRRVLDVSCRRHASSMMSGSCASPQHWYHQAGAFPGEVGTGSPAENATTKQRLERCGAALRDGWVTRPNVCTVDVRAYGSVSVEVHCDGTGVVSRSSRRSDGSAGRLRPHPPSSTHGPAAPLPERGSPHHLPAL
jgi:hypothetical protein